MPNSILDKDENLKSVLWQNFVIQVQMTKQALNSRKNYHLVSPSLLENPDVIAIILAMKMISFPKAAHLCVP